MRKLGLYLLFHHEAFKKSFGEIRLKLPKVSFTKNYTTMHKLRMLKAKDS
jgi:hypothetical protein